MGSVINRQTTAALYTEAAIVINRLKKSMEKSEELIKTLTSSSMRDSLSGGDGDTIIAALNQVDANQGVVASKINTSIVDVLDQKIRDMKKLASDNSGTQSKVNKLKESENNISALKR